MTATAPAPGVVQFEAEDVLGADGWVEVRCPSTHHPRRDRCDRILFCYRPPFMGIVSQVCERGCGEAFTIGIRSTG